MSLTNEGMSLLKASAIENYEKLTRGMGAGNEAIINGPLDGFHKAINEAVLCHARGARERGVRDTQRHQELVQSFQQATDILFKKIHRSSPVAKAYVALDVIVGLSEVWQHAVAGRIADIQVSVYDRYLKERMKLSTMRSEVFDNYILHVMGHNPLVTWLAEKRAKEQVQDALLAYRVRLAATMHPESQPEWFLHTFKDAADEVLRTARDKRQFQNEPAARAALALYVFHEARTRLIARDRDSVANRRTIMNDAQRAFDKAILGMRMPVRQRFLAGALPFHPKKFG